MLGKKFRRSLADWLFSAGKALSFLPLSASQFTALSIPLAVIAAYFLAVQEFPLALLFVVLAILVDVLDGSFAKAKGMKSNFGNYFDAIVDKVVECVFYIGFAFIAPIPAILALAGTMLESYAKPRVGLVIIADNHDWPAIGERADRLLLLILGLLAAVLFPYFSMALVESVLLLVFLLTLLGFAQRVSYARKLILKAEKGKTLLPYLRKPKKLKQ